MTEAPDDFQFTVTPDPDERVKPDHTQSGGEPDAPATPGNDPKAWRERLRVRRDSRPRDEKPPKRERPTPPKPRPGELAKPLTETYVGIGLVVSAFDPACGMAVMKNADSCAKSLEELARVNPAVRRALVALMQTGAWGQVVAAHLPILAVVVAHHGPKDLADMARPLAVKLNDDADVPETTAREATKEDAA